MRLTEFCIYPGKLNRRTRRLSTDECQEKYSQEALEHGFTSKVDLFCTLCQGTKTFVGCGSYKDCHKSPDSLISVYYKCYECSNIYSGIGCEKQSLSCAYLKTNNFPK